MTRTVVRRSILVNGYRTSVTLEDPFWASLKEIASERNVTAYNLVSEIDDRRGQGNLSSAVRLFVLDHYKKMASS